MFFDNLSWSVLNANGNTANLDEHLDGADLRWKRAKDVSKNVRRTNEESSHGSPVDKVH